MRATWAWAVRVEMTRRCAVSPFVRRWAISSAPPSWRGSGPPGGRRRTHPGALGHRRLEPLPTLAGVVELAELGVPQFLPVTGAFRSALEDREARAIRRLITRTGCRVPDLAPH
ncbi:hypothetical protein ACFYNO_27685 [Kitasatospora sp. NPDC006697]|uniref:hypothetical protein n=1 Tax=Kitasatospora sp. NPDC006697 TaxID=3364020 RepID=UPI0036D0852E